MNRLRHRLMVATITAALMLLMVGVALAQYDAPKSRPVYLPVVAGGRPPYVPTPTPDYSLPWLG